MKYLIFFLTTFYMSAQNNNKVDTLFVGDSQNVLIFFESPIVQGISGHSNYNFAFNVEEQDKFGIIRGVKGVDSNLHIITQDRRVYSFVLKYKKKLSNFSYFIKKSSAIGDLSDKKDKSLTFKKEVEKIEPITSYDDKETLNYNSDKNVDTTYYTTNRPLYYKRHTFQVSLNKNVFKRFHVFNNQVTMFLDGIYKNRGEVYFKIRIVNNSGVDYNANFIEFNKTAKSRFKNSTVQNIEIVPVFARNGFKTIPAKEERIAVYVFSKFGLSKNKKFQIQLNEKNGERNLILDLEDQFINNPHR